MNDENKMVLAAFDDREDADKAIQEFEKAGYNPKELSVITRENKDHAKDAVDNTVEGATEGAATGGIVGGLAGLLAGAGIVPALAGLFIGGPIAAALGLGGIAASTMSGAITGASVGGLVGALTNLGLSSEEAESYDKIVQSGGVVVGVPVKSENTPQTVLEANGAHSVNEVVLKK
jgi:uncharacterized membrane protein